MEIRLDKLKPIKSMDDIAVGEIFVWDSMYTWFYYKESENCIRVLACAGECEFLWDETVNSKETWKYAAEGSQILRLPKRLQSLWKCI